MLLGDFRFSSHLLDVSIQQCINSTHAFSTLFFFLLSEDSWESRVLNERQAINFITLLFGKFEFLFFCLFVFCFLWLKIILPQSEHSSGPILDPVTLLRCDGKGSNHIQTNDYLDNIDYKNIFKIKFCSDMLRADENKVKRTSMFFLHLKDGTTCALSTS